MISLRSLRLFGVCSLLAASSVSAAPLSDEPDRVIYQTYVRAFYDGSSVPDGEGDFAGIVARLPYLQDLGVDTLLLMPVFHSTGDMGYIPRDYFALDAAYGDIPDFQAFLAAVHAAGFKVILDAPVNHISFDSAWFRRSSQKNCDPRDVAHDPADPDNVYCDYFYWVAEPWATDPYRQWHKPWHWNTTDWSDVWFPRFEYDPRYHRPEYTYATFFSVMPDLKFWDFETHDWNHPVVDDIQRFFDTWTGMGVDGFRIDAAKHFVEGYGTNADPLEGRNRELLARWLDGARRVNPDVSFLGEIWAPHDQFEPYLEIPPGTDLGTPSLDMVLDFPFMTAARDSAGGRFGDRLKGILQHFQARQDQVKPGARVVFAGNHDVSRMMTEWGDDVQKLRLAHFITLLTPSTPLLYYGEEIGLHGKVKRPDATSDDEYVRTINAFPWSGDDATVGWPGGVEPVTQAADNWRERNLPAVQRDPASVWHLVRDLLRIRKDYGVTNATRLAVREDLFGHVTGWTLVTPDGDGQRCLTVLVNFHPDATYSVPSRHQDGRCGVATATFTESAAQEGDQVRLGPGGKAIFR